MTPPKAYFNHIERGRSSPSICTRIESFLRGAFIHTVGEVTVLLAVIASIIIFLHFWFWILILALLAVAAFLLYQRLRELTG